MKRISLSAIVAACAFVACVVGCKKQEGESVAISARTVTITTDDGKGAATAEPVTVKVFPVENFRNGKQGIEMVPMYKADGSQWCSKVVEGKDAKSCETEEGWRPIATRVEVRDVRTWVGNTTAAIGHGHSTAGLAEICAVEGGQCYRTSQFRCGVTDHNGFDEGNAGKCRGAQRCCPARVELVDLAKEREVKAAEERADKESSAARPSRGTRQEARAAVDRSTPVGGHGTQATVGK